MRIFAVPMLFLAGSATVVVGQLSPEVVAELRSADWSERQAAYRSLVADANRSPEADTALVSLLRREDEIVRAAYLESAGVSGSSDKYGEGYSEYTAWLAEAVMKIAEKEPDRQDVWPALLMSGYDPESAFTRWLATHGDKAAPFLVVSAEGNDRFFRREDALLVLSQIVGYERNPSTAHRLNGKEVQALEDIVRAGLRDKEWLVRYQAIKALAYMGTAEDLVTLERIASDDPEFVTDGGQSGTELRYPMRENARRAAEKLRKRLDAEKK